VFAEHESEEGERRIHASECVVAPLFSRLAEALGVLAVSSQKLDRRRGSSAAPFLLPGSSSALTAERKPGEPVQPSSRAILIEFFMVRALRKPKRQIARSASRRMAPRAKPTELYYWPTPNGWKISIMLEECGVRSIFRRDSNSRRGSRQSRLRADTGCFCDRPFLPTRLTDSTAS